MSVPLQTTHCAFPLSKLCGIDYSEAGEEAVVLVGDGLGV